MAGVPDITIRYNTSRINKGHRLNRRSHVIHIPHGDIVQAAEGDTSFGRVCLLFTVGCWPVFGSSLAEGCPDSRPSMYGIVTRIGPMYDPNVGNYSHPMDALER